MRQVLLMVIALLSFTANAQELQRRASLGVAGEAISDSLASVYAIEGGVLIKGLRDPGLQKVHGLRKGDILFRLEGVDIRSMSGLVAVVQSARERDKLQAEVIRGGRKKKIKGHYPALPYETSEDHQVIYDQFPFDGGYIRTIIARPEGEVKKPAVLFIQGYTCSSLDNMVDKHPYKQLTDGLCEKGYVVMRMEKPGMGDCTNLTPCAELDFNTEKEAYLHALRQLKSCDFVDSSRVFIWGHSLGGVIAPIIASEEKVKGIIVYGTTMKPWREYLLETFRFQYPILGMDYVDLENRMGDYYRINYELFLQKTEPSLIAKDSVLGEILRTQYQFDGQKGIFGRHYQTFTQIDDYNLADHWRRANTNVLVFRADADIAAYSKADHQTIVDIVNHYHPGKGTFMELHNTNHSFAKVESLRHGLENRDWSYISNNFNSDIVQTSYEYLSKWSEQTPESY